MNYNIVIIIAVIWLVINVLNVVLKSFFAYEFTQLLQTFGVTIKPIQILFNTQTFNRIFYLLSNWRPKVINKWFAFGTVVTLLAIIPSVYLIITTIHSLLVANYSDSNRNAVKTQALYPVIPGINLPMSDFLYYFISLAICSIYHETGHALAALREGVRLHSFGLFIFIIIPGAFVDLSTEQVLNLNVWNQLKIFTAGVWHNISLALFAIALLLINPLVLSPLYSQPEGVVVAYIEPFSGASGPNGLRSSDLIIGIDNCQINDISNWKHCLLSIANNPRDGYCVSNDFIEREATFGKNSKQCCNENSEKSLCFTSDTTDRQKWMCLPVRQLLDNSSDKICSASNDCAIKGEKNSICVKPVSDYNSTKLIRIKRQGKPNVLFWGSPSELYQSIILVKYKPKLTSLPLLAIHYYETLLRLESNPFFPQLMADFKDFGLLLNLLIESIFYRYIISFSLALAVFNVIPCVYLDGQWITNALIELTLKSRVNQMTKRFISNIVITIGTVLLSFCVILGLYQLLKI